MGENVIILHEVGQPASASIPPENEQLNICQVVNSNCRSKGLHQASKELTKVGWRKGWKITGTIDSDASQFTSTCNMTTLAVFLDVSVS